MSTIRHAPGEQFRSAAPLLPMPRPTARLSTWSRVHDAAFHGPERPLKALATAVLVFVFFAALVAVWGLA